MHWRESRISKSPISDKRAGELVRFPLPKGRYTVRHKHGMAEISVKKP